MLILATWGLVGSAPIAEGQVYASWPFDTTEAQRRQKETADRLAVPVEREIDLGNGVKLMLVLIPAGEFVMGAPEGESLLDPDERPQTKVRIEKPFWIGKFEVTNQQYRLFDPSHNSRTIDTHWKDRVGPGIPVNGDRQPVVRVSWEQAVWFCQWLSAKAGAPCRLPTEPEWEYACRAGSAAPYSFGAGEDQLPKFANFADQSVASVKPWALRDGRFNDGAPVSVEVGRYQPNVWGLHDMHGNVCEWCLSLYKPYPYQSNEGRENPKRIGPRVVRGGSWDDRPRRVRSAFRLNYPQDYRVYNVGFRVVCLTQ